MNEDKTKNNPKWLTIAKEAYQIWITERPAQFAASIAYYAIFSFVPVIYVIFVLAEFIFSKLSISDRFYTELSNLMGTQVALYLHEGVANLANSSSGGTLLASFISFIAILLSTSVIFLQIQHTLNTIWLVPPRPKGSTIALVRNRLIALLMLLGIFLFFILGAIANLLVSFIASQIQLKFIVSILSFVMLVALGMLSFALFYKLLPRAYVAWKHIWPAAGVAALLVALIVQLIGGFVSTSKFSSAIEAAGTMTVMLIAFYLLGQIFVLGAVLIRVHAAIDGESVIPLEK